MKVEIDKQNNNFEIKVPNNSLKPNSITPFEIYIKKEKNIKEYKFKIKLSEVNTKGFEIDCQIKVNSSDLIIFLK